MFSVEVSRYDKIEDVISEIKLYAVKNTRKQKIQKQKASQWKDLEQILLTEL